MSSIIKGGRIRNQGIINLSDRVSERPAAEEVYEEAACTYENETTESHHVTSSAIAEKREELASLEEQISTKLEAANAKVDELLSEAYAKASQIEEDTKTQQTAMIAQACEKQQQVIAEAEEEAARIREAALSEKQQLLQGTEGEVVETMITLLQHIISDELSFNQTWLKLVVRKMLQKLDLDEKVVLCVSPNRYEELLNQKEELLLSVKKLADIKEDDSLNDSTCKLITSEGSIEYDVNQGLEKVISELRILKSLS